MQSKANMKKPKFKLADVALHVETDNDLVEAIQALVEALAYNVEALAQKEGVAVEGPEVSDALIPEADGAVRDAVYEFIESALDGLQR